MSKELSPKRCVLCRNYKMHMATNGVCSSPKFPRGKRIYDETFKVIEVVGCDSMEGILNATD